LLEGIYKPVLSATKEVEARGTLEPTSVGPPLAKYLQITIKKPKIKFLFFLGKQ
jgi:hypothetical protein